MRLCVVIPTHNPNPGSLARVLEGLRVQTLPVAEWDLVLVDNASNPAVAGRADLSWHPTGRIVREERLGLTAARIAVFTEASAETVVLVDDDNLLAPDYLEQAGQIAADFPFLGSWSGNVELVFEPGVEPPPTAWRPYLTERRCEQAVWSNDPSHHDSTPWGAGLCVRGGLARAYKRGSEADPDRLKLDLNGTQLIYGGDTDIAYHGCTLGMGKGVFPQLRVTHLIPARRCERAYLLRLIEGRAYSEVLHHWVLHKTLPSEGNRGLRRHAEPLKRAIRLLLSDADGRAEERAKERGRRRALGELGKTAAGKLQA
jgi:glycosyltransferase involved in cell wall biosynthesis